MANSTITESVQVFHWVTTKISVVFYLDFFMFYSVILFRILRYLSDGRGVLSVWYGLVRHRRRLSVLSHRHVFTAWLVFVLQMSRGHLRVRGRLLPLQRRLLQSRGLGPVRGLPGRLLFAFAGKCVRACASWICGGAVVSVRL